MDAKELEARRSHIVSGCLGGSIRTTRRFTPQELSERSLRGVATPLDLMPREYWWPEGLPFPQFGSEMLGADF